MKSLEEMSKDELDKLTVDMEKELREQITAKMEVETKKGEIQLAIDKLQVEKTELMNACKKANSNIRTIDSTLRAIKTVYFSNRRLQGL